MSDPPSEADGQSLNIDQLIADYKARTKAGEQFSFEKLLEAHPEHTAELTRYFQEWKESETPPQPDKAGAEESSTETSASGKISFEDATAHTMIQGTGDSESSLTRDFRQPNTEATAEIEISKTFSRYEIQKVLGQGAMGAVYLARDTQLDRNVALKIPKFGDGNGVDEEELLARFYREARAAATLRSPNICPVYDVGEIDGQHYITMAFIEGRPLKDYTKSKKTHSEKQIITTIRKLALGLAEAHEIGVIHRDLKPANIMVDLKGEPVVMDFGLARRSSSDDVQVTQSGAIIGTPAYMAPEQVAGDQTAIDHRVDIYALGIIMYELITGEMPFKGNLMALLQQIALNNPTKPSELRSDIDPRLEAICLKMIAGDREQRYQSMTDVANDLQEVLRNPDERHKQAQAKKKGPKPKTLPTAKEESNPALISIDRSKSSADRMRANQGTSAQKSTSSGPSKKLLIAGGIGGLLLLLGIAFFVRPGKQDEQIAAASSVITPKKQLQAPEAKVVEPVSSPPPVAVAPFDAAQAKAHQKAWAKYLGVPVEQEVELPGGEKISFMLIPPGEFMMGSGEQEKDEYLAEAEAAKDTWSIKSIQTEFPQQHVKITKPFYLGKFEVTQAQWKSVMGSNPSKFNKNLQNPVDTVSWDDIDQFLVKSNTVTASQSFSFTLPTQAQWEFACRAGGATAWHDTESEADLAQVAWHKGNALGQTHPVGQLHPNAFGLYDMHGNVLEWCSDFHSLEVAQTAVKLDPVGPTTGKQRIRRGGHIFAEPRHCRAAYKGWFTPDGRQDFGGFRLAMTINTKTASPPPLAVAPFDATQAQKYQQEWADYLGEPVETTNSIGMKFTIIPPGKFKMGEGDNVVDVTLTKPFRLGVHELTQGQWKAVMETEPWKGQQEVREGENFAASFLDWSDVTEFCRKLTERERTAGRLREGWEYRLPTEAEWEYACRAGTTTRFSFGDSESLLGEYAWSEENTRNVNKAYAQPVGLKKPNPWGLYDIHGNVREWCSDRLGNRLAGGTDPTGPVAGSSRMYRGGGWDIAAS
ncbi:MAG: SUMF1/EgtB/PvdO family nonheme iron enzyme, partial [Planctomycetaceae bacterium]|nr:SUMF1/EgtB/PvdO family nonheme iron enzyme [Planctomycetaceae bacterium]